jgi:hypothetical protein
MADTLTKAQYIDNIIGVFTGMHKLIYDEAQPPTRDLLAAYEEIRTSPPKELEKNKPLLKERVQNCIDKFADINKRLKSGYKASAVPVPLQMTLPACQSKMSEQLAFGVKGGRSILQYLDTNDISYLNKAHDLLKPFSVA